MSGSDGRLVRLLQEARHKLEAERRRRTEPIAIVGIGCRFPGGASSPAAFWQMLDRGIDATGEVPADRWDADALYDPDPDAPGKCYVKRGGFLERIDGFEPEFFGISPREAVGLDPQQRLLLEVTWEALENAGIPGHSLSGSATGVWIGLCLDDYARRSISSGRLERIDPYNALGTLRSVAAGRLAYVLGLHGPVMQLDTSCSSSLVALHLACQSLRAGECDLALAGGVSLISSPETTVALCKMHALSRDGRCKTFDSAADGYGRGEGCGVVVLKRLADAQAAGDRIYAVVRGSAVNHDGRSNGLTAPNGVAQEAVIRAALANAGLEPGAVGYIEAHGTGTLLGDPIEVLALHRLYGSARSQQSPLYIGSVKTNFGHLEGAAGIAGVIKTALCLTRRQIAPHLHFRNPNPKIPWRDLAIRVVGETVDWPRHGSTAVAGVSSFGISGTNAHVLLEEAEAAEAHVPDLNRSAELIVLSARTDDGLRAAARRMIEHLESRPELTLGAVAYSLMTTRSPLERRLALAVPTRAALGSALAEHVRNETPLSRSPRALGAKIVFVFPGQGSQWLGMGRQLLLEEPTFRKALEECDRAIAAEAGWSVLDELAATAERSRLDHIEVVQPVLFAMEIALSALWRSWGVEPDAVVGHSMGEVAAACVAGALSLEDGARIMCRRSALLRRISGSGQMALVELSMGEATSALSGFEDRLAVAVSNSRRSTVISGDASAMAELLARLEARGVFCRRVKVDVASHSPQVDPLLDELRECLEDIEPRPARISIRSTVTGGALDGRELTAKYWADNLRRPVCFAQVIESLWADGFTLFVEMSPHPLLAPAVEEIRQDLGAEGAAVGSLRREQPERLTLLESLGSLHTNGLALQPNRLFPEGGERVELPLYPWQRQRYWIDSPPLPPSAGEIAAHPLLGIRVSSAAADAVYETLWSTHDPAWLEAHRVSGQVVAPAVVVAELVRAAAEDSRKGLSCEVTELVFAAPLLLQGARRVQVVLTENGTCASVFSGAAGATEWKLHATASVGVAADRAPEALDVTALRHRCPEAVELPAVYRSFAAEGLDYGPAFRGLRALWRGQGEALAQVELGKGVSADGYGIHPILLDAALQAIAALTVSEAQGRALLPFEFGRFAVHKLGASSAMVLVRAVEPIAVDRVVVDVTLMDAVGQIIAEMKRVRLLRAHPGELGRKQTVKDAVYRLEWRETPFTEPPAPPAGRWVVATIGDGEKSRRIVEELRARGAACQEVEISHLGEVRAEHVICPWGASGEAEAAMLAAQQGLGVVHASSRPEDPPRLWWITSAAVAVAPGDDVAVACSTVWGLGRSVMQEYPELRCTLLDVGHEGSTVDALLREAGANDEETQVAWREGKRYVARLVRPSAALALPETENYRLQIERKGTLDGLQLVAASRREPGPGELEIEIAASGLNFRDVVVALGMRSIEGLGGECAGVVTRVGEGVQDFSVGQPVMALVAGAFGRFVTVDSRCVAAVPPGLSLQQAATVPVAFLTAWYALHDLACLKRGERLLVHSAAGGVGMAAVQLANWLGAEVFATASASKWHTVRSLGVRDVANSRDLSFVEMFPPGGGGVDVVLNSLTGAFVDTGLSLLSRGGRFIEMGKMDVRDPVGVADAHPGVKYRAFDILDAGLARIAEMFGAVCQGFAEGHLKPLPVRTFPLQEAESAFRFMAQAKHVGKLALLPPRPLRLDGTVLVTGGLGALGLLVSRALAERGVRHLVLAGRRGLTTPGVAEAVTELETLGTRVTVAAIDVADRDAMARVLAQVPPELPLRGVIHAAGVLDDGVLSEQTADRFRRVMAPKVLGAWNLHTLTRNADLDWFVLFSSVAGTLGSGGQGAYAAGNAFLDALAGSRRAAGLPALSIAWGPWAEAGLAATLDEGMKTRLVRQGFSLISSNVGLSLFDALSNRPEAELIAAPLDARALARAFGDSIPPIWRALLRSSVVNAPADRGALLQQLEALTADQRALELTDWVKTEIARVLSLAGSNSVPSDKPLKDLGVDSLMGLELRNALGRRVGLALPATLVFDYPTPKAISAYLSGRLFESARTPHLTPATATRAASEEPLAIVGIGCRFPGGVTDPESLWRLLEKGDDAITEVPKDRWDVAEWFDPDPDASGKITSRWGGFLQNIEQFEPGFFEISPREAVAIDPQERLLLETTWEALERAGIVPDSLMGSDTAVYMGLCGTEYQARAVADIGAPDPYRILGTMHSTIVGRLSYWLGLKGASVPIDTACSSSLVAVHLACQALRSGECALALAGGANVLLDPEASVHLSRLRALSPHGRCRAFSADADGFVRSEGAGVVILERLADARKNGHPVLALIRGTAVNQDGRSNGLTAPNGPSQQAVIRQALHRAGVAPREVGYVECHGTGTALGDPIEVQALAAVLEEGRSREHPVIIGSLKTNLGHMEGAAGIGGLIKAVLTLRNGRIPKSLHFREPNPHIPWSELPVRVATEMVEWPGNGTSRIAGVSSFGISGTNAHVIVAEPPPTEVHAPGPVRAAELIVLSARTDHALNESAARLQRELEVQPQLAVGDVAYSLAHTRSFMERRLAISVTTRSELVSALAACARGETPSGAARGTARESTGKLAFLFTGQGAQHLGMGQALAREWAAFRGALDAACALLDKELDRPIREVMWADLQSAGADSLHQTIYTQPALFAFEWALAALWQSWGVRPDVVAGHSIGEIVAACVAGVFTLADAVRLVCARGRLMQALPGGGAMVAIAAPEDEVSAAIQAYRQTVAIAALNGPSSVVISGDEAAVLRVAELFMGRGIESKRLSVSHAFHSPLMDPMLDQFQIVAESISYRAPIIPLVSNLTGERAGSDVATSGYWVQHVRQPVRFARGVRALHEVGALTFLELGPRATLLPLVSACLGQDTSLLLPSMRAGVSEIRAVLEALGRWFAEGGRVDFKGVFPAGGRRLELPTYPWQRSRHWIERPSTGAREGVPSSGHPLLGTRIRAAGSDAVYESVLSPSEPAWLGEHWVGGRLVVPGAAVAELVRAAAEDFLGVTAELRNLVLQSPLVLLDQSGRRVQVVLADNGSRASVHSQPVDRAPGADWTLHAVGEIGAASIALPPRLDLQAIRRRCDVVGDVAATYATLKSLGIDYGPAFRGLRQLWLGEGEVLALVGIDDRANISAYGLHPALFDAALQAIVSLVDAEPPGAFLPFEFGRVVVHRHGAATALVHARLVEGSSRDHIVADIVLADDAGGVVAEVGGMLARRASLPALERHEDRVEGGALYRLDWAPAEVSQASRAIAGKVVLVSLGERTDARSVAAALSEAGALCEQRSVEQLSRGLAADHVVCMWDQGNSEVAIPATIQGLAIVRALAGKENGPRLWWVTRGAVAVSPDDDVAVGPSTVWGLGRTVAHEHPELRCSLLDVEVAAPLADVLAHELSADDDETQVAWRGRQRHLARLVRAPSMPRVHQAEGHSSKRAAPLGAKLRREGTVLLSGGLGALGLEVARHLAERGIKHLLLLGRRGLESPGAAEAVAGLEALGARVTVKAVDVADRASLSDVLGASVPPELPLRGVVHLAGILDDGVLAEQTPERFTRVMTPKVVGAWNLHELTKEADLDMFVLFSSLAGTLGSASQAAYSAANAFLDALASYRRANGLPALSLGWGPWAERGMAAGLRGTLQGRFARQGLRMIAPSEGLAFFDQAVLRPEAHLVIASLDLGQVTMALRGIIPPIWRALLRTRTALAPLTSSEEWAREIMSLAESARLVAVLGLVRSETARLLQLPSSEDVPLERQLTDLGVDSLMALELRNALARRTAMPLPSTLILHFPTVQAIAKHLLGQALVFAKAEGASAPDAIAYGERLGRIPVPSVRLFCFHDAGGSAASFAAFQELAAVGVEIHAISHTRSGSAAAANATQYLREATAYIRRFSDRPFALFGHSLGGFFAWRVFEELTDQRAPSPFILALSASPAAAVLGEGAGDDDLEDAFRVIFGKTAPAKESLKRDFFADSLLWRSMPIARHRVVDVQIAAFIGRDDHLASDSSMRAWAQSTTGEFSLTIVPGGHFYLQEEVPRRLMLGDLARRLTEKSGPERGAETRAGSGIESVSHK